ncbi:hypothetical protein HPB47_003502 [Ixodes persulcatus]|uniref:Uncharacterized protein n=1 Tax=Ixodes persulcatus TaxID=34615 RepID=A0AC60R0M1_IXOPE|nr:hypothetical protein HPB47_003502 [Ixodes persulcatus]
MGELNEALEAASGQGLLQSGSSVETRKKVAEGSILNSPSGARETSNGRWYNRWPEEVRVFLLQNVGIIVGVALLFLMAKYSEKIDFEPGAMPPGVRITAASLGAETHSGDSRAVFGAVGL